MQTLTTIAIDIQHSVFDNQHEAIMYITKDIYSDSYIISIPVITFSFDIVQERMDHDLDYLKNTVPISSLDKKDKLINEIKKAINELESI